MITELYSLSLEYIVFILFIGAISGFFTMALLRGSISNITLAEITNSFFFGMSFVAGIILILAAFDKKLAELLYKHSTVLLIGGLFVSLSTIERVLTMMQNSKKFK